MSKEGVLMLLYDLSMVTKTDARNYRKFRKNIIKNGFVMMQKSIYFRYLKNIDLSSFVIEKVMEKAPKDSNIKFIKLTLNQFERMNLDLLDKTNLDYIKNDILVV